MRYYVEDPHNKDRIIKIPRNIKEAIKNEALKEAADRLQALPVLLVDVRFDPSDPKRYVWAVPLDTATAAVMGHTND